MTVVVVLVATAIVVTSAVSRIRRRRLRARIERASVVPGGSTEGRGRSSFEIESANVMGVNRYGGPFSP